DPPATHWRYNTGSSRPACIHRPSGSAPRSTAAHSAQPTDKTPYKHNTLWTVPHIESCYGSRHHLRTEIPSLSCSDRRMDCAPLASPTEPPEPHPENQCLDENRPRTQGCLGVVLPHPRARGFPLTTRLRPETASHAPSR